MAAPMETVELRDGSNAPIGTPANPLYVSGGGSAANPYPGADYAKDGSDGTGTGNVGAGIRGWLATIAGRLAATLQVQLAAMLPAGTNTIGGVNSVNRSSPFAPISASVALAANAATTSAERDLGAATPYPWAMYRVFIRSDQAGTLYIYGKTSPGGPNYILAIQAVAANTTLIVSVPILFRVHQTQFVNGGTAAAAVAHSDGFTAN